MGFSMSSRRARMVICPKCGLIGYGPYPERVYDPSNQRFRLRMQVVHRFKTPGGYKTVRTCIL